MKFRLWDVKNNKFLLQSQFAVLGNGKVIISINKSLKDFENVDQKDFVLQRDSCNYDMYEKRIYEGDILSGTHYEDWEDIKGFESVRVVKWVDRVSGFRTFHIKDIEQNSNGLSIEIYDSEYIILGNLLEN